MNIKLVCLTAKVESTHLYFHDKFVRPKGILSVHPNQANHAIASKKITTHYLVTTKSPLTFNPHSLCKGQSGASTTIEPFGLDRYDYKLPMIESQELHNVGFMNKNHIQGLSGRGVGVWQFLIPC